MRITLPTGMTLRDWADQVTMDLDAYGSFGRIEDEENWQGWAGRFLNNLSLKENFPRPNEFADWREWAERFAQILA